MVTRSMSIMRIFGVSDMNVEYYKKIVKLVFIENEKTTLVDGGHKNTLTIHEYQGNEADKVVLIRLTVANDLYEKTNYVITGITRHKYVLIYCTIHTTDMCSSLVGRAYSSVELVSVQKSIKGGGTLVRYSPQSARSKNWLDQNPRLSDFVMSNHIIGISPMRMIHVTTRRQN